MSTREIIRQLLGEKISDRATLAAETPIEIVQVREVGKHVCRTACLVAGDMRLEDLISMRSVPLGTPVGGDYRSDWRSAVGEKMARRIDAQLARWSKTGPVGEILVSRVNEPVLAVEWDDGRAWLLSESRKVLARTGSDRGPYAMPAVRTGDSLVPLVIFLACGLLAIGVAAAVGCGDNALSTIATGVGLLLGPALGLGVAIKARGEMRRGLARAYADDTKPDSMPKS